MREMLVEQRDVFYYITLMNENYAQPSLPDGAAGDVLRGAYRFAPAAIDSARRVTLMGSGAILTEAIKAAALLAEHGVAAEVASVTSWSELARDGTANPDNHLRRLLGDGAGPVIAATDYVRAVPESVRAFVPQGREFHTLGTDGFGCSDTRAALRAHFSVDAASISRAALQALARS
jgi:pyruvate dehydrogenase E1 component